MDYHATHLALGAATENLHAALAALDGGAARPRSAPPDASGEFFRLDLPELDRDLPKPDACVWLRRHTNRSAYRNEGLSPSILPELAACGAAPMEIRTLTGRMINEAADWVREASEIRFRTREVNEWFAASLRYGANADAFSDGLHVGTLALPPGGVGLLRLISDWRRLAFLNALGAYKLLARIEAANFMRAPLVLAVVGGQEASPFEAGRCLQRVWLRLTEIGLSAHPYYVVSDLTQRLRRDWVPARCVGPARALTERIRSTLGEGQTLHCLLRVGIPTRTLPASGRMRPQQLLCDRIDA